MEKTGRKPPAPHRSNVLTGIDRPKGRIAMNPQTPYIEINEAVMDRNIRRMARSAADLHCRLRPHIKTHKIPEIARRQIEAGAYGITVAKLGEAEVMADGGIGDIFMAYPLIGEEKIQRAIALSRRIDRLILAADSLTGAQALSEAAVKAGLTMEIRMEIDTGLRRTGVPYREAAELARSMAALPGLHLTGIYTFKGTTYQEKATDDRQAAGREEGEMLTALRDELKELGPLEVSGGSTPTGLFAAAVPGVDEIRPGTYVFNDRMQATLGSCAPEDCALRVVYTVVSIPEPGRMIIDGGSKSIASDVAPGTAPYHLDGYGFCPEDPALVLERLTEEHGMVRLTPGAREYRVGDRVGFVPNHVCTTVNLHNRVILKTGDGIRTLDVAARGKLY